MKNDFEEVNAILSNRNTDVVILGGSREGSSSHMYATAYKVAHDIAKENRRVFVGGSTGIMEAASRGAIDANMDMSGCIASLEDEYLKEKYITSGLFIKLKSDIERTKVLTEKFKHFIVFPGGFGTLDELSSLMYNASKYRKINIILFDSSYWRPFKSWLVDFAMSRGYVSEEDIEDVSMLDSSKEVMNLLREKVNNS